MLHLVRYDITCISAIKKAKVKTSDDDDDDDR